jgi:hypothetical protein
VKEIRHVQFDGLNHKTTDLSVTVPYAGSFNLIFDYSAGTVTTDGLFRVSHPDGSGVLAMSAGRQLSSCATGHSRTSPETTRHSRGSRRYVPTSARPEDKGTSNNQQRSIRDES